MLTGASKSSLNSFTLTNLQFIQQTPIFMYGWNITNLW